MVRTARHLLVTLRPATFGLALLVGLGCGPSGEEAGDEAAQAEGAAGSASSAGSSGSSGSSGSEGGEAAAATAELEKGLLVAVSRFEQGEDGRPLPESDLLVLVPRAQDGGGGDDDGGEWEARHYEDPESNVFHKAFVWTPPGGEPGIVTLGGTAAAVKLWRPDGDGALAPVETLWEADFGGKHSRMRDAETADLYGDGGQAIAVATHDQGVVAVLRPEDDGEVEVLELDREPDTFVHEIEIGDLDGDGVPEVYATPSEPNRLDGSHQEGSVVRYVPAREEGPTVVADLGRRHAKEILVEDVDGDGRDELYVSIEAAEGGDLEIRRFDADTPPDGGHTIATLSDPMARFLTAGDTDGDGAKEMVVAAKDTGLWLLRPGDDPRERWQVALVDADSKGFEHASILADLDEDGRDELYVASDDDREIRRYVWQDGGFEREVIYRRDEPLPVLTWNLMPVPLDVLE